MIKMYGKHNANQKSRRPLFPLFTLQSALRGLWAKAVGRARLGHGAGGPAGGSTHLRLIYCCICVCKRNEHSGSPPSYQPGTRAFHSVRRVGNHTRAACSDLPPTGADRGRSPRAPPSGCRQEKAALADRRLTAPSHPTSVLLGDLPIYGVRREHKNRGLLQKAGDSC